MSLVGNRRYRTLHVGQQITVALGLPSRKFHLETIFIVIRILRGRGRIEQECGPGNREQLYGPQFDICGLDGNRIRDFRDAAPDFDSRQVGGDTHPVVAGQTLEAQRRRGLVTVQDDLAVIVAEVEVQVPNRCFVRTGHGNHPVGTNRYFDPNFHRAAAIRFILIDAAAQNAQREQ